MHQMKALQIRGMSIELLIRWYTTSAASWACHPLECAAPAHAVQQAGQRPPLIENSTSLKASTPARPSRPTAGTEAGRQINKQCFGGTDAHKEEYIGMGFTDFDRDITCNNDLIACVKDGGVAAFGGTERKLLLRHMKRYSLTATYGFRGYNRLLGLVFTPYRRSKVRNAFEHKL